MDSKQGGMDAAAAPIVWKGGKGGLVLMARPAEESDDFHPELLSDVRAYSLLFGHIVHKGVQAGGILGVLGAGIAAAVSPRYRSLPGSLSVVGMTTTGLALAVSAMGLGRIVTSVSDREACNDRIYRLWHNYGQRRTDTFASAGAMMGIAGAALALGMFSASRQRMPGDVWRVIGGAGLGSAAGVLAHVATMPKGKTLKESVETIKSGL